MFGNRDRWIPHWGAYERRSPRPANVLIPNWGRIVRRLLALALLLALLLGLFHWWRSMRFRQPGGVVSVESAATHVVSPGDNVRLNLPVTIPEMPASLDLMLATDLTHSYGDDLDSLKATANELAADLAAISDTRLGLSSFGDFSCCGGEGVDDDPFTVDQRLSSDADSWLSSIDDLPEPAGGGDEAEASLYALDRLTETGGLKWRETATKVIVLTTDADTKVPGSGGPGVPGNSLETVAQRIADQGIHLVVTAPEDATLPHLDALLDEVGGDRIAIQSDGSDLSAAVKAGVTAAVGSVVPKSDCGDLPVEFSPEVVTGPAGTEARVLATIDIPRGRAAGRIPCTVRAGSNSESVTIVIRTD